MPECSMTGLDEFFDVSNPVQDPLVLELKDMIRNKYANTPRHMQRALGPSQVGHPCMRKLAYGLMEVPRSNPEWDPLPSIYGTAMHTWLEDAAKLDNERLGRERWITESRVTVTDGLAGSSDLFDTDTNTVIDWKNLGYTSFVEQIKEIAPEYRGQLHLYGKGFQNAGFTVERVAIAILPRSGTLSKMHLWQEPYDDDFANGIVARRTAVIEMLDDFSVHIDPARYHWFPISPSKCQFCPWWRPEPKNPLQCSGKQ